MHQNGHQIISLTADVHFGACLGVFFYCTSFFKTMHRSTIPLRLI